MRKIWALLPLFLMTCGVAGCIVGVDGGDEEGHHRHHEDHRGHYEGDRGHYEGDRERERR